MTTNQLLFSLVSTEIAKDKTVKFDKKPDEETLKKLYKTAKAHDVAHIVCEALRKQGFLNDGETSGKFRKRKLVSVYRTEQIVFDLDNVCTCLEENGIDFIPLKGSVIRDLYPKKWMRTSCDIDILVKKEDCKRAEDILCEKLKFTLKSGKSLHDVQLLSPTGVLLELHHTLIEDDCLPKAAPFLENVWESAVVSEGNKHRHEMNKELFMLYHAAHTAKHFLRGGCGIKSFIDLYILEKNFGYRKEILEALLKKAELYDFFNACLKLCDMWFAGGEYDESLCDMEGFVLAGGVYGTASNSASISAGKGESKAKSFLGKVFLSYEALCVVYPKLKGHKWKYPFYQVKRWFRIFDRDKRKKISDLTTIRNSVSDEKQQKAKNLIDRLGLE